MRSKTALGMVQTTVLVSPQFWDLCKKYHITFTEAVRVGISVLLAERGVMDYDNSLNITRRVQDLKIKARDALQKAADIEDISGAEKKGAC